MEKWRDRPEPRVVRRTHGLSNRGLPTPQAGALSRLDYGPVSRECLPLIDSSFVRVPPDHLQSLCRIHGRQDLNAHPTILLGYPEPMMGGTQLEGGSIPDRLDHRSSERAVEIPLELQRHILGGLHRVVICL